MDSVISVKNLSKEFKVKDRKGFWKDTFYPSYKNVNAVKDISFEIKKGESVAFLGPNGAGKTTTTKMLTGLIYPSVGTVEVLGYTPFERDYTFLKRIGLVMGNKAGLNWDLTPNQSFELLRQIYDIDKTTYTKRITELTKLLDTEKFLNTQVRKLSLGERMKMEIIGAILHNPEILFLDEPTIGLDITSKNRIREFLRQIQKESGITILLTSHDMDDVEKVCDRIIVINQGQKVYDDNIQELLSKYQKFKYVKFLFNKKENSYPALDGSEIIEKKDNYIILKVDSNKLPDVISVYTKKYSLDDIDIISTPLEEIIEDIFNTNS